MLTPSIVIVPRFGRPFGAKSVNLSQTSPGEFALTYYPDDTEGGGFIPIGEIASIYVGDVPGRRGDGNWWKAIPDITAALRERLEKEPPSHVLAKSEDGCITSIEWDGESRYAVIDLRLFDEFFAAVARLQAKNPASPDPLRVFVCGLWWRLGNPEPVVVVEQLSGRVVHGPLAAPEDVCDPRSAP